MSAFFAVLGVLTILLTPFLTFVLLICAATKKAYSKIGIALATCILSAYCLFALSIIVSPMTWCKHEMEVISEQSATCIQNGNTVSRCTLCGFEHMEKRDPIGHSMIEVDRKEPSAEANGAITYQCENCGEIKVATFDGEASIAPTTETKNDIAPSDMLMMLTQLGYTTEHAGEIEHILTMVGVTEIKIYGSYGEAEGDLNAVWCYPNGENNDEKRIVLVTECGVVCFINIANRDDEYLYDADAGGFVKSYTDVYFPEIDVSSEAQIILQMMAEDVARDLVNYPLTVEFDLWKWQYSRRDREYIVQGGFTCTNALGIPSEHTIKLVCEASEDYARISVTTIYLDGKNVAPKN